MLDLATSVLYYGDNLDILRRYLPDAPSTSSTSRSGRSTDKRKKNVMEQGD